MNETVEQDASYDSYRALCSAAVISLLFGLLSVCAFLSEYLCVIPIFGILLGVYALVQIKQRRGELTGEVFAYVGIALSLVLLASSAGYMSYIYFTEVPEDHDRIHYAQLQPEEGKADQRFPPFAEEIDGKKVFIKGYVFPGGAQQQGIKSFLLVRDRGDCCFGGNPKVTDRIQVTLADPHRLEFSPRLHKIAGTFRLSQEPRRAIDAPGALYYYLDDCILR